MDKDKKKYLDELREEIDPEILSKMVNHFTETGDDGGSVTRISGASAAEMIRERRALRFQEKIAQRKRKNIQLDVSLNNSKNLKDKWRILILSSIDIWSRIVDSQFKALGFTDSENFTEFDSLIRYIVKEHKNDTLGVSAIAVALQEIANFLYSWESLRRGNEEYKRIPFLDDIPYFLVVESQWQIPDQLIKILGVDSIICITDEIELNREKVENAMSNQKVKEKRGEG